MPRPPDLARGATCCVFALTVALSNADASDTGKWFESLKVPGTSLGCCSIADCHRTDARIDARGQWWVRLRAESWQTPRWRIVPSDRILAEPRSLDGEAYVCQTQGRPERRILGSINGETYIAPAVDPTIRCFVPPDFGS